MNLAGKDATEDFEDTAHSQKARDWCDRYVVGVLEGASEATKQRKKLPGEAGSTSGGGGGGMGTYLGLANGALALAAIAFAVMKF